MAKKSNSPVDVSSSNVGDGDGGLTMLRAGVVSLVFIAIIAAALALATADFQDQVAECPSSKTYNESDNVCENSTGGNESTPTNTAFNITDDGLTGVKNATGFFSTIGTLLGVAALVAIVVGAFAFFRR